MTAEELQAWVDEHIDDIVCFMDYEPTIETDEDLAGTLRYWFDREDWNDGQRFVHLGIDGMGSQFAAWVRPGSNETPIVYFGSEGGRGVLVGSPRDWALALAYAPWIDEYPTDDGPAGLTEGEVEDEAQEALESYRGALQARFGAVPSLEQLTSGLEDLNKEFLAWVESRLG